MRKLKLQVQISIDGFIAGPNGEMDWMIWNWTDDLKKYVAELTKPVDTILLGKNLALGFIPHWTAAAQNPETEEIARIFVDTPKVVFTKTLTTSEWDRTTLANGNLAEEVNKLKSLEGKDMIAYGGGKFVSSLIKEKLIDELHLFINPTVLGKGMPIFQEVADPQKYELITCRQFQCGIAVLTYKVI